MFRLLSILGAVALIVTLASADASAQLFRRGGGGCNSGCGGGGGCGVSGGCNVGSSGCNIGGSSGCNISQAPAQQPASQQDLLQQPSTSAGTVKLPSASTAKKVRTIDSKAALAFCAPLPPLDANAISDGKVLIAKLPPAKKPKAADARTLVASK